MPDGKRKRRHSPNRAKRQWYVQYRASRFGRRFGLGNTGNGLASLATVRLTLARY